MIDHLYDLSTVGGPLLLAVAALILFVESGSLLGLALPGSSTVLVVGVVVGAGDISVGPAILVLTVGTTMGSQTSFLRGRRRHGGGGGSPAGGARAWMQRLFDRDPAVASAASHLFGGARTVGPRLAGSSPMSYRSFAVVDSVVSSVWVTALVVTGRFAGQDPTVALPLLGFGAVLLLGTYGVVRTVRRVDAPAVFAHESTGV